MGLNRSSLYYEPAGMTDYNLLLMDLIDKQYTETPYYGIRRMTEELNNKGYRVNRKRVWRLMRLMGLEFILMDGWGRVFDNIFIEHLWRTLKYEEVYLKDYADVWDAEKSIADYFRFYNNRRIHQSLDYKTPREVYFGIEEVGKLEPYIGYRDYLNSGSQWS